MIFDPSITLSGVFKIYEQHGFSDRGALFNEKAAEVFARAYGHIVNGCLEPTAATRRYFEKHKRIARGTNSMEGWHSYLKAPVEGEILETTS